MEPFTYAKPIDEASAMRDGTAERTVFIAGGTTLVDLMRLEVLRPTALVDITALPYATIEETGGGVKTRARPQLNHGCRLYGFSHRSGLTRLV